MGEEKSVLKPGSLEINMTFTRQKPQITQQWLMYFFMKNIGWH